LAVLALVLALLALAAIAYGGWQWRQHRGAQQDRSKVVQQLRGQVQGLDHQVKKLDKQVHALGGKAQSVQRSVKSANQQRAKQNASQQSLQAHQQYLRREVAGMADRVKSLEHAVSSLVRTNRHGRETMALEQAMMLLRMAQQRYVLFHDSAGAMHALTMADQVLAGLSDPAVGGVRQSLDAERKALAATHPGTRSADLAALAQLRSAIMSLPLKPRSGRGGASHPHGFWQRVWHALSTAVVIRRTHRSGQQVADAHLARELAALDVAQAEAARLAWRPKASHAALERVAKALDSVFDTHDARVRKAQAEIKRLLDERAAPRPRLGKALRELEDIKGVREGAAPAMSGSLPAPAMSDAAPAMNGSAPAPAASRAVPAHAGSAT
jgi:uroporphyrin-3 C-methyltransferase